MKQTHRLTIFNLDGTFVKSIDKLSEVIQLLASYGAVFDHVVINKHPQWVEGNRELIEQLATEYDIPNYVAVTQPAPYYTQEHYHPDKEMRLICNGSGIFYINVGEYIVQLRVYTGDYLVVPANIKHWFTSRGFVAIRFQSEGLKWHAVPTNSNLHKMFR